ncbi:iron-containing alcohol dehydrogenase [bacterium]|nr:iron-containing alcohol dehydrogenase [bacterium]
MTDLIVHATHMLKEFKGENYAFGSGVLDDSPGRFAAEFGRKALFVGPLASPWFSPIRERILASLKQAGVEVVEEVQTAEPNAPVEDVYCIYGRIAELKPDVLVVADSGSGIDAVKAAAVLATLGIDPPDINPFFGMGKVTEAFEGSGKSPMPVVAIMMASSSGAHLTKYSNITDLAAGQKKLIVDEAIIPPRAVFDYDVSTTQPMSLTLDGGLDGIAHCLEVYLGAPVESREGIRQVAELGIELIIKGLIEVKKDAASLEARTLLGLGTDLGGYAIMIGGTSGAHLTSFSLVDVLSHGRACALMNPYYTVFFAPAIQEQLRVIGRIYGKYGFLKYGSFETDLDALSGRELGVAVAGAMVRFSQFLGFPTRLSDVEGVSREHIERCLEAAKDPQLDMKLRNMPVSLNAELVDRYMGPILEAAWTGEFGKIKSM